MQKSSEWIESRYVYRKGRLRASLDPDEVRAGSRLMVDLVAAKYDKYLKQFSRGRLLDLGCGRVPLFGAYREYVTGSMCVDREGSLHKTGHVDQRLDLDEDLPFEDGSFETIILSDVLEHIPDPGRLWGEISRLLSPGGHLLMNVPFFYTLHEKPHDYYRYTEFALKRFVRISGLELVLIETLGGLPEIRADLFAKRACRIPLIGAALAGLVQSWVYLHTRSGHGKRVSEKTSRSFPLGYFLVAEKTSIQAPTTPASR